MFPITRVGTVQVCVKSFLSTLLVLEISISFLVSVKGVTKMESGLIAEFVCAIISSPVNSSGKGSHFHYTEPASFSPSAFYTYFMVLYNEKMDKFGLSKI